MMECREALEQLPDLLDAALDEAQASHLHAHLAICTSCAEEFHLQEEMRTLVREGATRHTAPLGFRARIEVILEEANRSRGWLGQAFSFLHAKPWVPAVAFALLVVVGVTVSTWFLLPPRPPSPLLAETVNQHIRVLLRMEREALQPLDPQKLLTFFQGKLDFGLALPPSREGGFELVGSELTYLLDRKVACLIYRKGSHLTTLFVLRKSGMKTPPGNSLEVDDRRLSFAKYKGFTVLIWGGEELLYSLVSDLDEKDLTPLAKRITEI